MHLCDLLLGKWLCCVLTSLLSETMVVFLFFLFFKGDIITKHLFFGKTKGCLKWWCKIFITQHIKAYIFFSCFGLFWCNTKQQAAVVASLNKTDVCVFGRYETNAVFSVFFCTLALITMLREVVMINYWSGDMTFFWLHADDNNDDAICWGTGQSRKNMHYCIKFI